MGQGAARYATVRRGHGQHIFLSRRRPVTFMTTGGHTKQACWSWHVPGSPTRSKNVPSPGGPVRIGKAKAARPGPPPALYLPAAVGYGGDDRLFRRAAFHHQSRTKRIQKEKSWRIF